MAREPLFPQVHAWPNLLLAHRKAARGKRGRGPAARFEVDLADQLVRLRDELRSQTYRPGGYDSFWIHEPKQRLISAAPFADRVVHHALCNVIEPLFERRFIFDSYANRRGKGTHRAIDRCQQLARRYRYALPCDVRQHFPSIDHAILLRTLARVIRDDRVLWLCKTIVDSGAGVLDGHYDMVYFPGDDLFAVNRPRGLPIGNLTSQFWSNCYLDPFDHFVKRELRCRAYLRYVDDILLFDDDRRTLWAWKRAIQERLAQLRLTVHERRAQVLQAGAGIPWLGFVVYPTHRRVKRRNVVSSRRRLVALVERYHRGEASFGEVQASIRGWVEHVRHGDSWGLRRAVLGKIRLRPGEVRERPAGREDLI
jgi:hypothetical protein